MFRRIITATLTKTRHYATQRTTHASSMEERIRTRLESDLQPVHYELVNESYKHSVPKGSETHFKVRSRVIIVTRLIIDLLPPYLMQYCCINIAPINYGA